MQRLSAWVLTVGACLFVLHMSACSDRAIDVGSDSGIETRDTTVGIGRAAEEGSRITVSYSISLDDGTTVIDLLGDRKSHTFTIGDGTVIPGMDIAVRGMQPGGVRTARIPWSAGYGRLGYAGVIPERSTLHALIHMRSVSRPGVYN